MSGQTKEQMLAVLHWARDNGKRVRFIPHPDNEAHMWRGEKTCLEGVPDRGRVLWDLPGSTYCYRAGPPDREAPGLTGVELLEGDMPGYVPPEGLPAPDTELEPSRPLHVYRKLVVEDADAGVSLTYVDSEGPCVLVRQAGSVMTVDLDLMRTLVAEVDRMERER